MAIINCPITYREYDTSTFSSGWQGLRDQASQASFGTTIPANWSRHFSSDGSAQIRRIVARIDTSGLSGKTILNAHIDSNRPTDVEAYGIVETVVSGFAVMVSCDHDGTTAAGYDISHFGTTKYAYHYHAAAIGGHEDDIEFRQGSPNYSLIIELNAAGLAALNTAGMTYFGILQLTDRNNLDPIDEYTPDGSPELNYRLGISAANLHVEILDPPPVAPTLLTATCAIPAGEPVLPDAPVASATTDVSYGVAPLTVNFTDTSTNTPTSWAWDFNDGSTSTSQNPSHIFTSAGTYVVSFTATNATGSRTFLMVINVSSSPIITPPDSGVVIPTGLMGGRAAYFAVDRENNVVRGYGPTGTLIFSFGQLGTGNGEFFNPTTISVVNGRQLLDRVVIEEE